MKPTRELTLAITLAIVLTGGGWAAVEADDGLPTGIFALDGLDPDLPTEDLEPLQKILRKTPVVGLGEAVHTTRGFTEAKARLFRYMVEEMGFRVLGYESSWWAADRAADYVATCNGSATAALSSLFGVWQNRTMRDLLSWMCEWNRRNPEDPVHFYGFDHQQSGGDSRNLRFFLRRIGLAVDDPRILPLHECDLFVAPARSDLDACLAAFEEILDLFDSNEADIVARTSRKELEYARLYIVGLAAHQRQLFYRAQEEASRSFEARDEGMAIIALELRRLRFPNAKTVLWAHNAHVAKGGYVADAVSFGGFLKKSLKKKYKAIGIVAHEAAVDWPGVGCGTFRTAEEGSLEARLRMLGEPYLLVDLKFRGAEEPFLPRGTAFDHNWGVERVPRSLYQGLVYMDLAEKMLPLAWRACDSG